jgi:hypothetical protein
MTHLPEEFVWYVHGHRHALYAADRSTMDSGSDPGTNCITF